MDEHIVQEEQEKETGALEHKDQCHHHDHDHDHEHEEFHEHHHHDHDHDHEGHHDDHEHHHHHDDEESCGCGHHHHDHDHDHEGHHDHHEHHHHHDDEESCGCGHHHHDHDHDHEGHHDHHHHEHNHGHQYDIPGFRIFETHSHEGATICSFEKDIKKDKSGVVSAMEQSIHTLEHWLDETDAVIGHVKGYVKETGAITTFSTVGCGLNIEEHDSDTICVGFAAIVIGPEEETLKDKVAEIFADL